MPRDTFERYVITAVNENKLKNFIFDNYHLWTYELLRRLLKTILTLEPVKRKLAKRQLQSRFLNAITRSKEYSHPELKNND